MKRGSISISMWLALAIAAAIIPVLWGQTRATLTGRVTDATGAVVPGTKLTLVNTATNETKAVTTGANGEFTFLQLAPGQYTLTSEHDGFRKAVRSGIVLEVGQEARIDVSLELGAVTE